MKRVKLLISTQTNQGVWEERAWGPVDSPNLTFDGCRFQKVTGFGGCFNELGWEALGALNPSDRKKLLDLFFLPDQALSLTLGRVPIGASDYALDWYSHHEVEGDWALKAFSIERDYRRLMPFVKEAVSRNPELVLFASPWSPPVWMKEPRAYNFGTLRWTREVRDAYALYLVKFVEEWHKSGLCISQLHVQNEPMADQKFPSCRWSGEHLRDFIRDNLGPLVQERIPGTEVWLGTLNGPFADYAHDPGTTQGLTQSFAQFAGLVLDDPGARAYISGVGYQWGGKNAIEQTHAAWPEIRLMQTESECGDGQNTWGQALYIFHLIRHYFIHGVESYCWWNLVLAEGGASTWGWHQNSPVTIDLDKGTYKLNPEFHLMRHVAPALAKESVRLGLRGLWSAHALMFQLPSGEVVLVAANPYPSPRKLVFSDHGSGFEITLPPGALATMKFRLEGSDAE